MTLDQYVDSVQRTGRYTVTTDEAARVVDLSPSGWAKALRRLHASGRIVRPLPRRGFFIIIPHEYWSIGSPPAAWYLGDLMRFLGVDAYYVGLLTAAEWHGASHFAVQETQVVVPRRLRPIRVGRDMIRFFQRNDAAATPVEELQVETGMIRVSTPEATAVDLVRAAAGLSTTATVLADLKERLRLPALRRALDSANDVTAAQRLGYLLELAGQTEAASLVAEWLSMRPRRVRALDASVPSRDAPIAERWALRVNVDVEVA
jgi:predicted transcriptional regulator of viral defense system